jgi:hypothetical protein
MNRKLLSIDAFGGLWALWMAAPCSTALHIRVLLWLISHDTWFRDSFVLVYCVMLFTSAHSFPIALVSSSFRFLAALLLFIACEHWLSGCVCIRGSDVNVRIEMLHGSFLWGLWACGEGCHFSAWHALPLFLPLLFFSCCTAAPLFSLCFSVLKDQAYRNEGTETGRLHRGFRWHHHHGKEPATQPGPTWSIRRKRRPGNSKLSCAHPGLTFSARQVFSWS